MGAFGHLTYYKGRLDEFDSVDNTHLTPCAISQLAVFRRM